MRIFKKYAVPLAAIIFWLGMFLIVKAMNISHTNPNFWAWNDIIGWIQFSNTGDTMTPNVGDTKLTGYATSSAGEVSLDCGTTSIGDICGTSDYKVINDGQGNLSGWAWNDQYGWISFCGGNSTSNCPGTVPYRVLIDANSTGDFTNYAWNDVLGWISFNCSDPGVCDTSQYKVNTTWRATSTSGYLDSAIFDMGSGGGQLNSFFWLGSLPGGTVVKFQFAGSNSTSGPWNYYGPLGTANDYYSPVSPDVSTPIVATYYANLRYFRYRITLVTNVGQTQTPRVDDVIVNWSP